MSTYHYLIDSSVLAAYLNGRRRATEMLTPWIQQDLAATSQLVYAEVNEYLLGFPDYLRRFADLRSMIRLVPSLRLNRAILERYGQIRRSLRPPNGPGMIGDIDTLIASTALEHGLTVVTSDSDYQRVPGLTLSLVARDDLRA